MQKKIRTIAIQVDDPDFIAQYEARVKESGLSLKKYLVGLMKADIENPMVFASAQIDAAPQESAVQQTPEILPAESSPAGTDLTEQEQGDDPALRPYDPAATEPEEMMNLFVKITSEQREALELQKNETGETVGSIINRMIGDFLDNARSGNLPEGFEDTYQYYADNISLCDTKASAKIPSRCNQEISEYLDAFGGSRNALMASLVHMELYSQSMEQGQSQGMTAMSM